MDSTVHNETTTGKTPFLTIGIASYNYAHYLRKAFEAIKGQKFKDFEVLYCDDGSTDDSVAVIHALMEENPDMTIRLVQGKNSGVMGNKNRILDNARGEYVMLCDADDYMLDNCLETLCSLARKTGADQVVGAFRQTDENGDVLQVQEVPDHLSRWTWGVHHATIYKMQVIRDNALRFDVRCYPDDIYFNMIFHHASHTLAHTNTVLYTWNMHDTSASAVRATEDQWHGYPMLKNCLSYVGPIAKKYGGDEYQQIEYTAIKAYCLANLYRYGGVPLKEFLDEYKRIRACMTEAFPDYRRNAYVRKPDAGKIVRKPTAHAIWLFVLAERTHTIRLLLAMYWLVSKYKKFTI